MAAKTVHIVEATLRDGGYEIDHQFTADDTAVLTSAFDSAGFSYIEVGHGNGVGISEWPAHLWNGVQAAATDEQHLRAAQKVAKRVQYGVLMVALPGHTPVSYVDRLPPLGVKFVRIALTPAAFMDHAHWIPYIERIKALGMIASINLMQTAAIPVKTVVEGAVVGAQHGLDWFFVVDSFGGMQPAT